MFMKAIVSVWVCVEREKDLHRDWKPTYRVVRYSETVHVMKLNGSAKLFQCIAMCNFHFQ